MLRFIQPGKRLLAFACDISIHPMLRFIKRAKCPLYYIFDFNTSHVTVYRLTWADLDAKMRFQYIPCYGLSLFTFKKRSASNLFQYIPCYGLSAELQSDQRQSSKFQYIPCYGLSERKVVKNGNN